MGFDIRGIRGIHEIHGIHETLGIQDAELLLIQRIGLDH